MNKRAGTGGSAANAAGGGAANGGVTTSNKEPGSKIRKILAALGARSYSGAYAPLIHVDDIAVGTQPIGCGRGGAESGGLPAYAGHERQYTLSIRTLFLLVETSGGHSPIPALACLFGTKIGFDFAICALLAVPTRRFRAQLARRAAPSARRPLLPSA